MQAGTSPAAATRPAPVARLRFGELSIEGRSRAGEETWFRVQPPGMALDVGRGPLRLIGVSSIFLSHGHLDHATGLPYLLSQRSLQGLGETTVYCPRPKAAAVERLVAAAAELEERDYGCAIVPLEPGDCVALGDFTVEAFATDHVVSSLGFHLVHHKRRLAERYRGLSGERIVELKRAGEEVSEVREVLWLSYCGDTGPGVLESEPRIFQARVLLLECTFAADEMRQRSRRYGHLHVDDLVAHRADFRNEALVLHHLSRRHRLAELRRLVDERLPGLAERIHLLGEADER